MRLLFTIDTDRRVTMDFDEGAMVAHVQLVAEFCLHYCCMRADDGYEAKREEIERRSITYREM